MNIEQQAQEIQQNIPSEKIDEMITQAVGGLQLVILFYDIENNKYIVSDYDYNRMNNDYSFIHIDHLRNNEDIEELLFIPCSQCLDCPHTERNKHECLKHQIQEYHKTNHTYNEIQTSLYYHQQQQKHSYPTIQ